MAELFQKEIYERKKERKKETMRERERSKTLCKTKRIPLLGDT